MFSKNNTFSTLSESLRVSYLWQVFLKNKRDVFLLPCIFALLVFLVSLNIEKKYSSTSTLVIKPEENKKIVNIEEVYTQDSQVNRINNQIAILKSEEVIEAVLKNNNLVVKFNEIVSTSDVPFYNRILNKKLTFNETNIKKYFRDNFRVSNIPRSDILEISFVSTHPKIAQLALNSIIDSYQKYELDSKVKITSYANQKITERLKELNEQMSESQLKLASYKKTNGLVDTGNVKEIKIGEIQSLSKRIQDTEKSILESESDISAIKLANGNIDQLIAIKDLATRDEVKNIKNLLTTNQGNIASLRLVYTENHPKLIQALELEKSQKEQLKTILNENAQLKAVELNNLKSFLVASKKNLDNTTKEFRELEDKESGMLNFQREVESNQKLYESFLQRVKETNEAQNLQVSNIQLIEMPNVPIIPISPNLLKNSMLGYLMSLITVFCIVLYRSLSVETVIGTAELTTFNKSTMGHLPRVTNVRKGFHLLQNYIEDNESNFSESIRMLRTGIVSKFKKHTTILVTSSNPSEGKTTVAFNLALSLEKNHKVLIIEADTKRPSVVKAFYQFEENKNLGFSDLITNQARFEETIVRVPGTNLDLVTSGESRIDITDAVSTDQLKSFFSTLASIYDYVIVDSPPVLPVADTLVIGQAVDYTLFVVRSETTRVMSTMISINRLKEVGNNIDGFILNDFDHSKNNDYYGDYSSYYDNYKYNNRA
jgi:capsular exopolysaccharide synthesis family protein